MKIMTFLNKLKLYLGIAISLLSIAHISGCTKDGTLGGSSLTSLPLSIQATMQSGEQTNNTVISCTRLIVLDKSTMTIIFNKSTEDGLSGTVNGNQTYSLKLEPGEYQTYIVTNETQAMKSALADAATLDDLKAITVMGQFDETNIPMSGSQDFIFRKKQSAEPTESTEVSTDGGVSWSKNLEVTLLRTQSKVSLYLRKKTGHADEIKITKVELQNIPDYSFLIPKAYESANPQSKVCFNSPSGITLSNDTPEGSEELSTYTTIFNTGSIFPEKIMTDNTVGSKATYLKIYATYGAKQTTYNVKLRNNLVIENYDLARNIDYKVYATLKNDGEISAVYLAPKWTEEEIDGDVAVPYLNISELNPQFNASRDKDGNTTIETLTYSYYFWTNRPADQITVEWDTESPISTLQEAPVLTISKNTTTADGIHDVAGKVDIKVNSGWINANFHAINIVQGKMCLLKTDKLSRTLNASIKGTIIPAISSPTPASGTLEGTKTGNSYSLSKTCFFEFSAFFDASMTVVVNGIGYSQVTLTEQNRTENTDGSISVNFKADVDAKPENIRWLNKGTHEIPLRIYDNVSKKDLCTPTLFNLTIDRVNY